MIYDDLPDRGIICCCDSSTRYDRSTDTGLFLGHPTHDLMAASQRSETLRVRGGPSPGRASGVAKAKEWLDHSCVAGGKPRRSTLVGPAGAGWPAGPSADCGVGWPTEEPALLVISDGAPETLVVEWSGIVGAARYQYRTSTWNDRYYRRNPWTEWKDLPVGARVTRSRLTNLDSETGYLIQVRALDKDGQVALAVQGSGFTPAC